MTYISRLIKKAGTLIGNRKNINFVEGANITLTMVDDSINDEIDITIASTGGGGASWGGITGTLSDQTDLQTELDGKQDVLTGLTSSVAELNILDGATLTVTELNYVDGVTSAIQTQLNAKLDDTQFDGLAKISVGTTTPVAPSTGDLWVDTN